MTRLTRSLIVILFVILAKMAAAVGATAAASKVPPGWLAAGKDPGSYEMLIDRAVAYGGKGAGCIRSTQKPSGFGTLMQSFRAEMYQGKRVRMSAYVKLSEVKKWAGLWMRVDTQDRSVAFDNMQNRPLHGTQIWRQHSIVLDVPSDATRIAFGVLLDGEGSVWVDEFRFEEAGLDVPVTDLERRDPKTPVNLSFEEP